MKHKSRIGLGILGLCVVGMLIMPVAAAPAGVIHQVSGAQVNQTLPQAVKDDLWSVHMKYRLQQFDLNIQKATDVITVLDKHQYETTSLKTTLAEIVEKRPALESAVSTNDKTAVKTVNVDLINLWKEFGKTLKTVLKGDVAI